MTTLLQNTEKYFTNTEEEAESLLIKLKDENRNSVIKSSIDKKTKKEDEYFILSITVEHNLVKDLLEI